MQKQETDERITLANLMDRREAAMHRGTPVWTQFLSPRERELAEQALRGRRDGPGYAFWGGFAGAERTVCIFFPDRGPKDEAEPALRELMEGPRPPLGYVRAVCRGLGQSGVSAPSHRDYLGALLGAGLRREALGDLLVHPEGCDIVLLRELREFVLLNFTSAGRMPLDCHPIGEAELRLGRPETEEISASVASLRLDAVLAAGLHLAREKAAALAETGRVSVNGQLCEKPDRQLSEGDLLSVRGAGRLKLAACGGLSRKGRTRIVIQKYI